MSHNMDMARVLVVDDEETILISLEVLLETDGHEVVKTTSSEKAVELLKTEHFDLLMTDIRMTPLDGLEVMRQAREQSPTIPLIALSAYTSNTAMERAREIGCSAYIKKPFKVQEVVTIVNRALAGGTSFE